jgi:hypothetical protein
MKKSIALFTILIATITQAQISKIPQAQKFQSSSSGYFRIVAKGFTCNKETNDDILERDGKRDEIYLTSLSVMLDRANNTLPNTAVKVRSRNMGDINGRGPESKWALAGSAGGGLGGIQTGDNIPDMEPWKNNAPASGDLLPFVLWEGKLESGGNSVIIHPTIMEYDGPADFLTNFWTNSFLGIFTKATVGLASVPFQALGIGGGLFNNSYDNGPGVWPVPTAVQQYNDVFYKLDLAALSAQEQAKYAVRSDAPNDRPIGLNNNSQFAPLEIRLNYTNAQSIAEKDFGYGKGIVPILFRDAERLAGEYTLYVAFEKINSSSEQNRINIKYQDAFDPLANYSFRNVLADNKEADILNGGRENNTLVVLNDLKGLTSQRWKIKKVNQFNYNIVNNYNNLSLDILNKNNINGSNIVTSAPDNSPTQQWTFIRYCDGSWLVRNVATTRLMEVYNAGTEVGAPLGQWDANFLRNQRWYIEKK